MLNDRKRFCDTYQDKPPEWWDIVFFTDESLFRIDQRAELDFGLEEGEEVTDMQKCDS